MKKKLSSLLILTAILTALFIFLPTSSMASSVKNENELSTREIKEINRVLGYSEKTHVATEEEYNTLYKYLDNELEKYPNKKFSKNEVNEIKKTLDLEHLTIVSEEELELKQQSTFQMSSISLPNYVNVNWVNPNRTSTLFKADLKYTNSGVDPVDVISGKVQGLAILPGNNLYTVTMDVYFQESNCWPTMSAVLIQNYSIAHYGKNAKLFAEWYVKDGNEWAVGTPRIIEG